MRLQARQCLYLDQCKLGCNRNAKEEEEEKSSISPLPARLALTLVRGLTWLVSSISMYTIYSTPQRDADVRRLRGYRVTQNGNK